MLDVHQQVAVNLIETTLKDEKRLRVRVWCRRVREYVFSQHDEDFKEDDGVVRFWIWFKLLRFHTLV